MKRLAFAFALLVFATACGTNSGIGPAEDASLSAQQGLDSQHPSGMVLSLDRPSALSKPATALAAVDPGSYLWATGGNGTTLIRIDVTTGVATTVGASGFSGTWAAAFTPDGTLWTVTNGFNSGSSNLAVFDLSTGAATNVGSPMGTGDVIVLESDSAGNLFAAGFNGNFYSVDTGTGQLTLIGNMGFFNIMDLAFDPAGTLWAVGQGNNLYTVDPVTGAGTHQTSISGLVGTTMGIAVSPDGDFYVTTYTSASRLYKLDPVAGTTTLIGSGLGSPFPHGGDILFSNKVEIDIKPGSDPNSINLKSKGVIPVAILTTDGFDATTVDGSTVEFEGANPAHGSGHLEDVDGDGDLDWVGHFRRAETGLDESSTEGILTGQTTDGQDLEGSDSVRIVPGSSKGK